ncbi:TIGR04282 family arsenosugar biosynthesis glycosyltransferase [Yeosuana sp. MJ-SS3]|uniref:TIGR04282 family arsenosugar biosynthesis glycosyltransferase n=1 Tax=Gilvirhabdus luticola TaxID=3079858 RepID=A0ABU3U414_9FLAO|nr:TIGR04282 family arsenosugar biosynthesis glycosyltransferase [Yeosuana sp. MJ-SS3]MDU8885155.1 TIGR04282 family arsenosugar biosynthesis glycosyltransferase [Yeosuana sp. MJ-SS3]
MNENLLIIFVKNIKLGKVKTRLAKTIGNKAAFEIYKILVDKTEKATEKLPMKKHIYFSDVIIDSKWIGDNKTIQNGSDLGARMKNAFKDGLKKGFKKIVLIGSDLPDIDESIIKKAFKVLNFKDTVFGPAEDGGYYLIGMKQLYTHVFDNKPWSESHLLEATLQELKSNNISFGLTETLNDIDTFEDLKSSSIYKIYSHD